MQAADTIAALSSGALPSGIAIVRVSGPDAQWVAERIAGASVPLRKPTLRALRDPATGDLIDRGIVLVFDGPGTATGEDVAEFHVHGGRAVVSALLDSLVRSANVRLAEPGEFTRRAFMAGRMDLTEIEGLADLLSAETAAQRRQALRLAGGVLRATAEDWRRRLVAIRARVEAELDFSDEDDVSDAVMAGVRPDAERLLVEFREVLASSRDGERLREGYRVAIVGPPNAGKSSLLNALAKRDVAIVTDVPGTTRDLVEVHLDLAGAPVTVVDTAGMRETMDPVEAIGVSRAEAAAAGADCVILLVDAVAGPTDFTAQPTDGDVLTVVNKIDLLATAETVRPGDLRVSARTGDGLDALVARLSDMSGRVTSRGESALVTRARQRSHLEAATSALAFAVAAFDDRPLEIVAEELRHTGDHLGRLSGRIDVEDVLDDIFATFCIGK